MKFLVDTMLIKLGRYLRFLGYDTAIVTLETDWKNSAHANRIFVTTSRKHFEQWPFGKKILLHSQGFENQLRELRGFIPLSIGEYFLSRCSRCNAVLEPLSREAVLPQVPPLVAKNFEHFYRCPQCGKIYWEGGHVKRLKQKLQRLGLDEQNRKGEYDD